MKLRNIQHNFADHIGADADAIDNAFRDLFKTGDIALENRMSVYRNNVIKSLRDVIIATYPMTGKMLGSDYMKKLARLYALDHKPSQANLNLYGEQFASFIAGFTQLADHPYLPDLAQLEWLINESDYAADDAALNPVQLASLPAAAQADLTLSLRSAVRIINSAYRLDQIQKLCAGEDIAIKNGSSIILVYRPDLQVLTMPLTAHEQAFLTLFTQPRPLSKALGRFTADHSEIDLTPLLEKFFSCGVFKIHQ